MKTKVIEITYSDKPITYNGGRLDKVIDWDLYYMQEWIKNNPGVFQVLCQTTITPRIGKMIITGTNPDESTNFLKDLFVNENYNFKK